jgi:hypothetical protein
LRAGVEAGLVGVGGGGDVSELSKVERALEASSRAISQVQPHARARRRQAMASVVLPTHVMPACRATHHERAGAL